MNRQMALILGAASALAFIFGLAAGHFVIPRGAFTPNAAQSGLDAARGEATPARYGFQSARGEGARRAAPIAVEGFQFLRLDFDLTGDAPKACFQFSEKLDASGKTNYGDYVRLSNGQKPVVDVNGSILCLSGLDFDTDYRATLRAGLPSAKNEKLARSEEVAVAFGDKPSFVGFVGDGVVLPRLEADGLGIETVNVEKVRVTVKRVSDRALAEKQLVKGDSIPEEDYFYVWDAESGDDVGVVVHESDIEIKSDRNQAKTSVFALGAALKDLKPGAYFIKLKDVSPGADESRAAQAWRWVMFTDMALTTYSSADGVDVFVRSLTSAKPLAGVRLALIAQNNDELAAAVTDNQGRARFEEAAVSGEYPLTPRMLMAYGPQSDFAALDLQRAPLDLSDRNVGGRVAPNKIDAFIWLDRGIYRPGETVRLSGLLRDEAGRAISDRPATITIRRPNSTEAEKRRIEKADLGGFSLDFALPAGAPRGVWSIEAHVDGLKSSVGGETFSVEDFVPQRLEVKLNMDEASPIRPGQQRRVEVDARFLYGAPASNLAVESEARLRIDPNPFPDFAKYRFGPVDARFDERFIQLPNATLGADGKTAFPLEISGVEPGVGVPLRADLVVGVVEPGGRVVRESARIPVRTDELYVGLKLTGDGAGFEERTPAEIDAVILGWDGKARAGELEWRLVEEDYWFDWYREDGQWRWRRSYKDVLIAEGRAATDIQKPARIAETLDPGSYRLVATEPASGAQSDIRFYVGWRSYEQGAESPDQAIVTAPQKAPAPGSKVSVTLDPPYAGEAIIAVATDRVHSIQRVKVDGKAKTIDIATDPNWGAGFYVLATIVTPRDAVEKPIPRRALGVAYVGFDMSARTLSLSVNAPELVRPRQKIEAPIQFSSVKRGEEVRLTLAAVDEGILRLTKFASPDPTAHYYGKKALGVELRDDYGRILNANLAAASKFGGDQLGGEGLTVVPTKSVALFSGVVKVGADGLVRVPIEVPDFNGELRLMAVAWSGDKLGAASRPLTVRDAVPAELSLPRFLAPGDTASATLLIDNVDGAAGEYRAALTGDAPLTLNAAQTVGLAKGAKETRLFALRAGETGVGAASLAVSGPGGFAVSRSYPLQVRSAFFPLAQVETQTLAAGQTYTANASLIAPYAPGSANVTVSFSRLRGVLPGPLFDALYRYPYGCSEQLTSAALPLLYADALGAEAGKGADRAVRPRVQKAVNQLLERQSADGAFGLWSEGDGWATPWLGAYVTDFLYRAKEAGYGVPDEALERSYKALQQIVKIDRWVNARYNMTVYEGPGSDDSNEKLRLRSAAYALYVLARAGKADLSDLRYFHDARLDKAPDALSKAHIGAGLAALGDRARAKGAFDAALAMVGAGNAGDYYQTPLRDAAGLLALATESGREDMLDPVAERFSELMKLPAEMHTQEQAFVLLASNALLRNSKPIVLSRNGETVRGAGAAPSFALTSEELKAGVAWRNDSGAPIFRTVSVSGAPIAPPDAAADGVSIDKQILSRAGAPVDLASVRQNDRLVVVLSGAPQVERSHQLVIADLLPAGFEIEAILKPEDGARSGESAGPYAFVGELSWAQLSEARDDRFVAALNVGRQSFRFAYLVRAVTPGSFVLPGAVVEDMYRPGVFARSAAGRVEIAPAQ